jgi:MFS transporter, Spinster family, sphingosine-1-phosphate transporter
VSLRASPWFLVFALTCVGTVNWADRQVVPILFPGIRSELGLSDTELGMIGGLAFSLIYALSSFVFGRAADSGIRRNLVAIGLVMWSAATAAGALATGFGSLFAARFLTGIGEASLYPSAMSLIAERFPVASRGRAMGVFGTSAALGGGVGVGLGGALAQLLGWRAVFVCYGVIGLAALPLLLSVPEAPRARHPDGATTAWSVVGTLLRDRRLLMVWSAGMVMMASAFGYSTWAPSFFVRVRGLDVAESGRLFGTALLVGGVAGSLLGGTFADRRRRRRLAGELDVSAAAALISAPLAFLALTLTWPAAYAVLTIVTPIAIFAFFPSLQTVIVEIVPPERHGLAYAINILFLAGIGAAAGPFVVGVVSDATGSLGAALVVPVAGMVIAAALIAAAGRAVRAAATGDEPLTGGAGR